MLGALFKRISWLLACLVWAGLAWGEAMPVPAELAPLMPARTTLLDQHAADLNGDGRADVVFVVEWLPKAGDDDDGARTLFVALRQVDGSLKIVKHNDKIVFCRQCGGIWGDPYGGLIVSNGRFSVNHFGGSNWRWSNSFDFAYSRRDSSWQLVSVDEGSFHTSDPEKAKTRRYKPPRDFGKIDIADFDPEHFKGVGPK
jgi:hypothetical protein